jgi:hypothetical protein
MDDYAEALEATRALVDSAVSELAALDAAADDDEAAYRHASAVVESLRTATIAAGSLRQLLVLRIRRKGNLSLAALAERIGVSRGRAQDLVTGNSRQRKAAAAATRREADGDALPRSH